MSDVDRADTVRFCSGAIPPISGRAPDVLGGTVSGSWNEPGQEPAAPRGYRPPPAPPYSPPEPSPAPEPPPYVPPEPAPYAPSAPPTYQPPPPPYVAAGPGYGQIPPQPPPYEPGADYFPFEPEPEPPRYEAPEEPPPYQPPPAPRRSWTLITVAAAAVIVVVAAVILFLIRTVGPSSTPSDAVGKYFNALKHRDLSAVQSAVCASMRDQVTSDTLPGHDEDVRHVTLKINSTEKKDDTHATVVATVSTPDEGPTHFSIATLKEGDTWRVCGAPRQTE
jgi:hypothetical protein